MFQSREMILATVPVASKIADNGRVNVLFLPILFIVNQLSNGFIDGAVLLHKVEEVVKAVIYGRLCFWR